LSRLGGPEASGHRHRYHDFFAYLFAGLGELLIGRILDVHHDASQVFLIVAAAGRVPRWRCSSAGEIPARRQSAHMEEPGEV